VPQRLDLWLMPSYSSVIYHHLRAGELAQALCTFEASPFLDLSSTFPGTFLQALCTFEASGGARAGGPLSLPLTLARSRVARRR